MQTVQGNSVQVHLEECTEGILFKLLRFGESNIQSIEQDPNTELGFGQCIVCRQKEEVDGDDTLLSLSRIWLVKGDAAADTTIWQLAALNALYRRT